MMEKTTMLRKWIANQLVRLARRIYPQSTEAMSFYMDRMIDLVATGESYIKVTALSPDEIEKARNIL